MTILLSDKIPFQILEIFYQFLSFSLWFSGNPIRSGKWVSFYLCCGYVASLSDTSLSQSLTECEPGINYFLCVFFFWDFILFLFFLGSVCKIQYHSTCVQIQTLLKAGLLSHYSSLSYRKSAFYPSGFSY